MDTNPSAPLKSVSDDLDRTVNQFRAAFDAAHYADGSHKRIFEQQRLVSLGQFIDVPKDIAMFSALVPMTWVAVASSLETWAYALIGDVMIVVLLLTNSTSGGTATTTLQITIPGGYLAKHSMPFTGWAYDGTNWLAIFGQTVAGSNQLLLYYPGAAGATWPLAALQVRLNIAFDIRT